METRQNVLTAFRKMLPHRAQFHDYIRNNSSLDKRSDIYKSIGGKKEKLRLGNIR